MRDPTSRWSFRKRVALITALVAATSVQQPALGVEPPVDGPSITDSPKDNAAAVPSVDNTVSVAIDLEGDVTVESDAGVSRCYAPCVLHLPKGLIRLRTKAGDARELVIDGQSRVSARAGVPTLRTAGLVAMGFGALVVTAAIAIPLFYCTSERTVVDVYGQRRVASPCKRR